MNKTSVIIFLVIVIVLIVLKKTTSNLDVQPDAAKVAAAAAAAADAKAAAKAPAPAPAGSTDSTLSKPLYDQAGNYQDVDIDKSGADGFKDSIALDPGKPSWNEANNNCWDRGSSCYGIRHDFDAKKTWYLTKDPKGKTDTSDLSVLTPTVQYNGESYSLPMAIVALKSASDPTPPTNCEWIENTPACVVPKCNTPGTPVSTTWTKSKEAKNGGTCAAPASKNVPCPAGPKCPWLPFTSLMGK
jgi:hypothetical protein